jgi:RNA polymerase sigma-70 factor, ECF subfamily
VRWQGAAERAMLKESRRLLRERLSIPQEELDSLLRFVRSHIQMSLTDLLRGSSGV